MIRMPQHHHDHFLAIQENGMFKLKVSQGITLPWFKCFITFQCLPFLVCSFLWTPLSWYLHRRPCRFGQWFSVSILYLQKIHCEGENLNLLLIIIKRDIWYNYDRVWKWYALKRKVTFLQAYDLNFITWRFIYDNEEKNSSSCILSDFLHALRNIHLLLSNITWISTRNFILYFVVVYICTDDKN